MAASMDLTSLAKLKAYLGLSAGDDDTLLTSLIDSASEAIEQYCGRPFARTERTELHDGCGSKSILLDCRPVASVASVHDDAGREFDDASLLPAENYTFYPESGVLTLDAGVFGDGRRNVQVVYTAGYASAPPAVEQAANILAAHFYNRGRQGGDGVVSETLGAYSVSYDAADWPGSVRALLTAYREASV